MNNPNQVAEIVTFKLASGAVDADFIAAASSVETKMGSSGQMLGRTLSRAEDGTWTDHVVWTTQAAADAAAKEIMSSPDCAGFLSMIDPESIVMGHGAIARRMD